MGMAERIMYNFENVTLEYNGKKFYILKQFEYKNKMYLYGVDVETAKSGDPNKCEFVFLYRVRDDIFNHVEDPDLRKHERLAEDGRNAHPEHASIEPKVPARQLRQAQGAAF